MDTASNKTSSCFSHVVQSCGISTLDISVEEADEFKAVLQLLGMFSILENCRYVRFDSLEGVTNNRYTVSKSFRLPKNIIVREHSSPINNVDSKQGDLITNEGNDISLSLVAEKEPLEEGKIESPKNCNNKYGFKTSSQCRQYYSY